MWSEWASATQKDTIKRTIFFEPEACQRVIAGYRKENLAAFNPLEDPSYFAEAIVSRMQHALSFKTGERTDITSLEGMMSILGIFKEWVENNDGWRSIQGYQSKNREKMVQRAVHLAAKHFVEVNDLDISFESNNGRGSLDVKLSRGNDKTIAEIKLSSNNRYMQGYEDQLAEYGKAENTTNLVYVFVDVGNHIRKGKLRRTHLQNQRNGLSCPELFLIDATEKTSASLFEEDDLLQL